jgi:SAM-dependent methyltransferase
LSVTHVAMSGIVLSVRNVLHRTLPESVFHRCRMAWRGSRLYARLLWWNIRYYAAGKLKATVVKRNPTVEIFPPNGRSPLAPQIRKINTAAPTPMCRIMTWHGSDKGRGRHTYTTIYSVLFKGLGNQPLRIFELGLGTNNPELLSSMGASGRPGASLRGWRDLFPRAQVFGADIDRTILFEENRIRTFYCDQLDAGAIHDLWSRPELDGGMDIIIEDGLHTFEANVSFLENSVRYLRPGGFYVIEDIIRPALDQWKDYLQGPQAPDSSMFDAALVQLPNPRNTFDNNLLIFRRAH